MKMAFPKQILNYIQFIHTDLQKLIFDTLKICLSNYFRKYVDDKKI